MHRLEPRRAVAECKATAALTGGDELNKFVGALDAEYKDRRHITGYFISLSGFKETALEQESQRRRTKIVTLTGSQVVSELVRGRILVGLDRATELAGRHCAALDHLVLDAEAELLAHELGWIWAVYYTQGKARTHFVLIHSDGTPLARVLANEVITADHSCGGNLHTLSCLNPAPLPGSDTDSQVSDALAAYGQYLNNECGYIQLDGLPADGDIGSRRLRLENLFVPLHLDITISNQNIERHPVGGALRTYPRLALLAAPGGGKSTLLKRLAIAYVDPLRREKIADDLPDHDWFPIFLRCRELRDLARGSFGELIEALSEREPVRQHASVFRAYVDRALLNGRVLLLVDGLDEISDPGDRAAFVCTLRTALQAYQGVAIVVTSREAGFRHVAAHLAPICTTSTLSPFDGDDIRSLSIAWHREVVNDTEKVRADADELATTIAQNDRIRRLAVNPLLLTTLLLVRRWVGSLPTRRSVLYGKAVEVLLMTWNTEGHGPIPEEEALPQLCYVASSMMLKGVQKISRPRLAALLQEAREALPTELGYVKGTVDEFIHRVEDRSSLLMMAGHDVEDGQLVEFFEFRHLTFQEFLAARALVQGWHPSRTEQDTLVTVLEPHFEEEAWREVIPLAAVLGGKSTESLIERLTERLRLVDREGEGDASLLFALGNCLADEAAARPDTIRAALRELVNFGSDLIKAPFTPSLVRGRYGADFRDEAAQAFIASMPLSGQAGDALTMAVWWQTLKTEDNEGYAGAAHQFAGMLEAQEMRTRCEGATGLGRLCFNILNEAPDTRTVCEGFIQQAAPQVIALLYEGNPPERAAALYAIAPLSTCRVWAPPAQLDLFARLYKLWRVKSDPLIQYLALRGFVAQDLLSRDDRLHCRSIPRREVESLVRRYERLLLREKPAALVLAWYFRALDDATIAERCEEILHLVDNSTARPTLQKLLQQL